jgi:hypothetical protein
MITESMRIDPAAYKVGLHPNLPTMVADMSVKRVLLGAYILLAQVPGGTLDARWEDLKEITLDELAVFLQIKRAK